MFAKSINHCKKPTWCSPCHQYPLPLPEFSFLSPTLCRSCSLWHTRAVTHGNRPLKPPGTFPFLQPSRVPASRGPATSPWFCTCCSFRFSPQTPQPPLLYLMNYYSTFKTQSKCYLLLWEVSKFSSKISCSPLGARGILLLYSQNKYLLNAYTALAKNSEPNVKHESAETPI